MIIETVIFIILEDFNSNIDDVLICPLKYSQRFSSQSVSHSHIQPHLLECLNGTWNTVAATTSFHSNNKIVNQQTNEGKTSIGEKRETVDLNDMKNMKEHEIDNI